MTLEQIQEKMAKLVQDAYALGFKDGSNGETLYTNIARPKDLVEVYAYMKQEYPQLEDRISWKLAKKWYSYFKSNGFKVGGKASMKDWRASVDYWDKEKELDEAEKKLYRQAQPQRNINY